MSSARLAGRRHLGRFVPWLLGAAAVAPSIPFAAALLTDPAAAPWMDDPRYITDRFQYVESNYAGYGLRDVVDYLRAAAAGQPIVVATRDSTGMPRDGVWAYLLGWPNVQLSLVPESQSIVQRLEEQPDHAFQLAAQGADLYYVLTDAPGGDQERRFVALNPQAVPLLDIPKPGDHSRFRLYQVHWDAGNSVTFLNPSPRLGGQVLLRGFRLSATSARPGDTLHLTLIWEATRRPARDYSVFTHLEDLSASKIWGQKDSQPVDGREPTSRWRPGDSIADRYDIPISPDAPPGTYDLLTGMYELKSLQRLPVDQGGASTDSVVLGRITVTAP